MSVPRIFIVSRDVLSKLTDDVVLSVDSDIVP